MKRVISFGYHICGRKNYSYPVFTGFNYETNKKVVVIDPSEINKQQNH